MHQKAENSCSEAVAFLVGENHNKLMEFIQPLLSHISCYDIITSLLNFHKEFRIFEIINMN